jgi:glycosyltransferase involved in cell wall biosynthesis
MGSSAKFAANGACRVWSQGLTPGGYAITVGRLEPRKNHLGLLRAYARLRKPRAPLVVVGQHHSGVRAIFDEVAVLGLREEMRFLQRVDDHTLPALLRHAQLFIYPSFAEGFGMPVAEAMASGVAVLTSATSALAEVAGDAALTADPHDPIDIARQWQRLVDDVPLRVRLAAGGPAHVAGYRWEFAAEVLIQTLRTHFGS